MTILEIILSSVGGLATVIFGGKFLWDYLITKSNNSFKLKKSRIEKDEKDIQELANSYQNLDLKYNNLELKYNQLLTSFKIMSPLFAELAKDNPSVKLAFEAMQELIIDE